MAQGLISKSELAILRAIDAAPNKVLDWAETRKAAGLTIVGHRRVMHSMMDRRLIAPSEEPATYRWPTITFKGMKTLAAEIDPWAEQVSA